MKKKIALSPEEMEVLASKGVDISTASMYWIGESLFLGTDNLPNDAIRTFCLDDILEMLPNTVGDVSIFYTGKLGSRFFVEYVNTKEGGRRLSSNSPSMLHAAHSIFLLCLKHYQVSNEYLK